MGDFVLTNAKVTINSVDLSDHVEQVSFSYEAEGVDDTNMGDTTRVMLGGLLSYGVDITFSQDFAAAKVDATLFSLVGSTTTVVLVPVNTTVSSTNPSFTGTMLLTSYSPIGGTVGDKATAPVHFDPAGAITRATS
jgi:hypothetical protein